MSNLTLKHSNIQTFQTNPTRYLCQNIPLMHSYDTVTEAVSGLKKRGYTIDFNIAEDCIVCKEPTLSLRPDEFEITETYRFEGPSDPADEAIVYAIESKHGQKGVLVNGYGPSADSMNTEMVRKLSMRH